VKITLTGNLKNKKMKTIYKIGILLASILIILPLYNCSDENEEFKYTHEINTIRQMVCRPSHSLKGYEGDIYEFNKDGKLMEGSFTQTDIEGGYGLIIFAISKSIEKEVDLSNIYLIATVDWDEFITPSLAGRHDITGDGIIITVTSGTGTLRQYRVRGYYE